MKRFCMILVLFSVASVHAQSKKITITATELQNKIKGGWAGQVIGVTFGGPVEFHFQGSMINDYQPIVWYDGYIKKSMTENPGLYDDLYMDLTFVDVFEKKGIDAPVEEHAKAYANAGYMLWHANQAGRYNILHGIMPPKSGQWQNNPHADDIDFQIEADFSGLMSPAMPNTAADIGDGIGHIMNYGDGWYGGVFVGAMYAQAFISKDIEDVVNEALRTIPQQSTFYQCMSDVIAWHAQYPEDWKRTWFEIQKKWSSEASCPDGVFSAFNIDAKVNSAYIVLGLLYGKGDYTKTLEITTRAGQDADCNPSSAGGILGTLLGYDKIPAYWKMGLKESEDIDFKYTTVSLNKVYALSYKHALQIIRKKGGVLNGENIVIESETPKAVRLEQSFEGQYPVEKRRFDRNISDEISFEFDGIGMVIRGEAVPVKQSSWDYKGDFAFEADLYIDGKKVESARLPANYVTRRHELFWKYQLPKGKHTVRMKVMNPSADFDLHMSDVLVYDDRPISK